MYRMLVSTYLSSFLCWLQVFAPRLDFLVQRFIPPSYMTGWGGSCRWLYGIRFTCGSSEELLLVSLWRVFVFAILELQVYSGNVHDSCGFMCKAESTGYTTVVCWIYWRYILNHVSKWIGIVTNTARAGCCFGWIVWLESFMPVVVVPAAMLRDHQEYGRHSSHVGRFAAKTVQCKFQSLGYSWIPSNGSIKHVGPWQFQTIFR